ncbi:MAG: allantoate amidohydrolase [Sphingobium sp.]
MGGVRAVERCDLIGLSPYSDMAGGLFRPYLGPAHRATLSLVEGWMREAGMTTRIDPAANLVGHYAGTTDSAPILLIGSHIDSVNDGGRYDGPLGIMLGIECVASLSERGMRLPFAIEVIAFGDEEGSRFPASMLTSRAVAGTLDPAALAIADREGASLGEALAGFGLDVATMPTAAKAPGSVFAYLEAHIEQGPVLEAEGLALGVVTGIAAQRRLAVTMTGTPGHAGTNSMALRRDALTAAAEAVLAIEAVARAGKSDLVATVGRMIVGPGATNVVPGRVDFTVDVRAGLDADRDAATASILAALDEVAAKRGIGLGVEETQALEASPCDPGLTDKLARAVASTGQEPMRLVSGAGHDAMVMADLAPTAMLFIRCGGGISHNPLESVIPEDADRALAAMIAFIGDLAA